MKKRKILLGIVILLALAYIYYGYGINPYFVRNKIKETTPLRFSDKPDILYYDYSFIFDCYDVVLKLSDKDFEYAKNLKIGRNWYFQTYDSTFNGRLATKLDGLGFVANDSLTFKSLEDVTTPHKSYGSGIYLGKNNIAVVNYTRNTFF